MALITNTDTSVLPYNDDEMVYDIDLHMYILTDLGISRLTGYDNIELSGNETKGKAIRYEVSQDIYNAIALHSMNASYDYKLYYIAKNEEVREKFKRALADQYRYYVRSGAGVLKDMTGVNITNGKALDINQIRGKVLLSQSAEIILTKLGLLYTGVQYYTEYDEDGTW